MENLNGCSEDELLVGIGGFHAEISAAQRNLLRFVREYDRRRLWKRDGCRHMGHWLSGHLGISVSAGLRWTHAAYALERLPLISAALEEGTLSLDKVLQLARFATPADERDLIRWARRVGVAAVRRRADLASRPRLEATRAAHDDRYIEWWLCDDGSRLMLEGMLPAAEGSLVTSALRRIAETLPGTPGREARLDQRCADALVALASTRVARDQEPDRATVVVQADMESFRDDATGCEVEGGPVIHPEVARRLACDCRLQIVLTDPNRRATGIGRTSRNVPRWLRRQLRHRDHGCTFPGCGTRSFLDAHHVVPWERGGPTDLDNLLMVCKFHHMLVHEGGWTVALGDRDGPAWHRPDGRRYEPAPPEPLSSKLVVDPELAGFG